MSAARHCDGPDCRTWATRGDITEAGFLVVETLGHGQGAVVDFCSWDCLLRYAAGITPTTEVRA